MVNFLALLGWSPGNDQEIFTRDELVASFALEGIGGGDAVFNREKLDWMNAQHIARLAPQELAARVRPLLETAGLWDPSYVTDRHAWLFNVLEILRPRAKRLHDFVELGNFFFTETVQYDPVAVEKFLRAGDMDEHLAALDSAYEQLETFDPSSLEAALRSVADARGMKAATLIHACRVAVTGKTVSPGLFEVVALVGRVRTHERLQAARRLISATRA
jgi:glutamyl/glutaminyl-tRNA synthetase